MISGSGRCHGPGCTQTAVVEYWCSERCQERWDSQLADAVEPRSLGAFRLHDVSFVDQPLTSEWTVRVAIDGHLSEDSARTFANAAERAAEMVGEVTAEPHPQPICSGTASSVMEDILRAYDLIEAMPAPEPVRLTQAQLDQLRADCPPPQQPIPSGAIETVIGHRIELVELEEDSTPYQLGFRTGTVETFEGDGPEFEELPPALDGDSEERVCRALTAPVATIDTVRRDEGGLHVTGRWLPLPEPSRGWLSRLFDRLFGRTT